MPGFNGQASVINGMREIMRQTASTRLPGMMASQLAMCLDALIALWPHR